MGALIDGCVNPLVLGTGKDVADIVAVGVTASCGINCHTRA